MLNLVYEQAEALVELNTNIFETNLVNLGIVVGVVVVLGGDALTSALDERRRAILESLEDANNRFAEAQARLAAVEEQLTNAKTEASSITSSAPAEAQTAAQLVLETASGEMTRLRDRVAADKTLAQTQTSGSIYRWMIGASIQVAQDALTVTKLTTKQESILGSCIQKLEKIQVDQIKVSSI